MSDATRFGLILEYVDDVAAAKAFYLDVLGLKIEREHPTFIQFVDPRGVNLAIASDESLSGTRAPETYWIVEDAEARFAALTAAGSVTISHPLQQAPFGTVFGVQAPSGQTEYFLQFAARRPSEAVE